MDPRAAVRTVLVTAATDGLVRGVAAVTRLAYRAGDAVAGLPVADGARETSQAVRTDLDSGYRFWVAIFQDDLVGSVRALPGAEAWTVRRLAVAPSARHLGLGRTLLRAVEEQARAAGANRVELDAVVERGNPAFYARAGYRTVWHFGAPDKPLSEVHMERVLAEPVVVGQYPEARDTFPPGLVRTWWDTPHGTACHIAHGAATDLTAQHAAVTAAGLPDPVLRGADCLPGAPVDLVPRLARWTRVGQVHQTRRGVLLFPVSGATPPAGFAQPRLLHDGLLAWWRIPPRPVGCPGVGKRRTGSAAAVT